MRIKEARIRSNITIQKVADYLCCDRKVYTRYESGEREPSVDVLIKLSRLYGVSVDYLKESDMVVDTSITKNEALLIRASRQADERAFADAMAILQIHKVGK